MSDPTAENLRMAALNYHEFPKPGKLEVRATKPLANGRDLARAYSPGVAEASIEIQKDPLAASRYTARGNLVAVIGMARCNDCQPVVSKGIGSGNYACIFAIMR